MLRFCYQQLCCCVLWTPEGIQSDKAHDRFRAREPGAIPYHCDFMTSTVVCEHDFLNTRKDLIWWFLVPKAVALYRVILGCSASVTSNCVVVCSEPQRGSIWVIQQQNRITTPEELNMDPWLKLRLKQHQLVFMRAAFFTRLVSFTIKRTVMLIAAAKKHQTEII